MRFDVSLVSFLFGATSLAAPWSPANSWQEGSVDHQIEHDESEIQRLEQAIRTEIAELEALDGPQHAHHGGPHGYSIPSSLAAPTTAAPAAPATPAVSTLVSSGSAGSPSVTVLTTLNTDSSSVAVSASEYLSSLSSVAQSLSSVISSVNCSTSTLASSISAASGSVAPYPTAASASASASASGIAASSSFYTAASGTGAPYSSGTAHSSSVFSAASGTGAPYSSGTAYNSSVFSAASGTGAPYSSGTAFSSGTAYSSGTAFSSSAPFTKVVSANSTSAFPTYTASGTGIMAPSTTAVSNSSVANVTMSSCASLCSNVNYFSSDNTVTVNTCQAYKANETITVTGGQADVACGSTILPEVDLCRVTLEITTSGSSSAYVEVWMPDSNTSSWNGRTINTDNGGLDGCVAYEQLQYLTGMGFAAIGDNGGHNSSAFDGTAFYEDHEAVLDWVYRSRHESVMAGKDLVKQFYGEAQKKSYYIGCSTGGQQGLHSAQYFPDDFDGIVAGSSAADMNHLEDWSSRFIQLTGVPGDASFLTEDQWIFVQSYIFAQCDAALDGVDDGIIEDPTICKFDTSAIPVCSGNSTDGCLTSTQITTVYEVFTALFNTEGNLLYPALLYGSQVDAFRLGQLSGSVQGIAHDWFAYAIYNNSNFDVTATNQTDYAYADSVDAYNGYPSSFNGDLSAFEAAGKKLIMYHGMADPLVSGANSQRYYLKVAKTLGYSDYTEMDPFLRLFRISGMAHCGVGGISGAGAWMFGQTGEAALPGVKDNIIQNIVDWVEEGDAPDTIVGTKFWYDEPSLGLEFYRPHCRFPFRTTYTGSGEWEDPANWNCTYIEDWQECGVGATPRLCNVDGTFDA